MSDWVVGDWAKARVGDTVRVEREERVHVGVLTGYSRDENNDPFKVDIEVQTRFEAPTGFELLRLYARDWSLFLPAKPAVEIPDEAGHYLDRKGKGWEILQGATSSLPQELAPYTRLESVAVTAKKVLHSMKAEWEQQYTFPAAYELECKRWGVTND